VEPKNRASEEEKPSDAATDAVKRPYSPPKVEEFGTVQELTKGTGMGRADTPMGTFSVRGV